MKTIIWAIWETISQTFFQLHLLQKIDFQPYYSSIQARDKAMQTFTQNTTKRSINLYGIFQSYQIVFFRVITAAAICWFCLMNSILASDAIMVWPHLSPPFFNEGQLCFGIIVFWIMNLVTYLNHACFIANLKLYRK